MKLRLVECFTEICNVIKLHHLNHSKTVLQPYLLVRNKQAVHRHIVLIRTQTSVKLR